MNKECFQHKEANETVSATVPVHKGVLSIFKLRISEDFVASSLKFLSINTDQKGKIGVCPPLHARHICSISISYFSCILIQLPCDGFPDHRKGQKALTPGPTATGTKTESWTRELEMDQCCKSSYSSV